MDQGSSKTPSPPWELVLRLNHPKLRRAYVTPSERYALTACMKCTTLWDIEKGRKLRTFATALGPHPLQSVEPKKSEDKSESEHKMSKKENSSSTSSNNEASWPLFHWNASEDFFVQRTKASLYLCAMSELSPVSIHKIEKEATLCFAWAPVASVLLYSVVSAASRPGGDQMTKVFVQQIKAGSQIQELSNRTVYEVNEVSMKWQPRSSCRYGGTGGSTGSSSDRAYCAVLMRRVGTQRRDKIDLYCVHGRKVDIEQIEVEGNVMEVVWDPEGREGARFCVTSTMKKGEKKTKHRQGFYRLSEGRARVMALREDTETSEVLWSPLGSHAVAKNANGMLEFLKVENNNVTVLQVQEHFSCTDAMWDNSGRYFLTSVSVHHTELDNGFRIYNFLGQLLMHQDLEKFSHFLWRPRPPTQLGMGRLKEIRDHIDEYVARYEATEERRRLLDQEEARSKEAAVMEKFTKWISEIRKENEPKTLERKKLQQNLEKKHGVVFVENTRVQEIVLESKEKVI